MPLRYLPAPVLALDHDRLVAEPVQVAVAGEHPVLDRQWPPGLERMPLGGDRVLAVVRVELAGTKAMELAVHSSAVKPIVDSICGLTNSQLPIAPTGRDVGDRGQPLDQLPVALLGLAQLLLALLLLGDVDHQALHLPQRTVGARAGDGPRRGSRRRGRRARSAGTPRLNGIAGLVAAHDLFHDRSRSSGCSSLGNSLLSDSHSSTE